MKLIALKDFRNVPALRLTDDGKSTVDKAVHDEHIHKGAVFDIGAGKTLDELRKSDRPTAEIVAQLVVAGCVGEANDAKVVAAVKEDLAQDSRRQATAEKLDTGKTK